MNETSPVQHRPRERQTVKAVLRLFVASNLRRLLLGCMMAAITALAGCILLGISGWFITATYIAGLSAGTAVAFDVFKPSATIRLLAVGRTASRYGERLTTHDATFTVLVNLREKLFRGWATPEALQQLRLRPSRVLFRLTRDLDALQAMYLRLIVPVSAALVTTIVSCIVLGAIHVWLGLGVFAVMLLVGFGISMVIARRSALASARSIQATERLRAHATDLIAGQLDLVMAGKLADKQQALMQADERLARADERVNKCEVGGGFAFGLFQATTLGLTLLLAAFLLEQGIVSGPGAILVILLTWSLCEVFAATRLGALETGKTRVAARRLAPHLLTETPETIPAHLPPLPLALSLSGVTYRYGGTQDTSRTVLDNIHLDIGHGERVAIIGASGSGKSTLLSLVTGEQRVQSGYCISTALCWLPQHTELFQDSVRDNLNLARQEVTDDQLWHVLEQAGLADDIRHTQQGLDTPLGEKGLGLSGGQSRRLALARLFLAQPEFWVLDEPTESLDKETAQEVIACIKANLDGKTLLVATHLRREAALADRIILLEDGRIKMDVLRNTPLFEEVISRLRED